MPSARPRGKSLAAMRRTAPRPQPMSRTCSSPRRPRDSRRRSEEHTSELQSRLHLVCRLLLEKKNQKIAFTEGNGYAGQLRIKLLAHLLDVLLFGDWSCLLPARDISVQLGGSGHEHVLRTQQL